MKKLIKKTKKQIPFWLGKKLRSGYQKSLSIWYKGHTYQCPYCKNEFRKLLSAGEKSEVIKKYQVIGSGYRENCSCPRCYSKDRDRLIYLYLEKETNIFKEKNCR